MTKQERAVVQQLTRKAHELEKVRDEVESQTFGADERGATGELNAVDQHPADVADFAFQRELSETQQRILQQEANQVQAALERAKAGQYGICVDCGEPIPKERLEARPEATSCIACQSRREREAR